jgi:mRNA interferase MazF
MYRFGDVVLLEYPFTDLDGVKLRPAIVVLDTEDTDIIVLRATSQHWETEYDFDLMDWQSAGLLKATTIRTHKIATLKSTLVKRVLGSLSENDATELSKRLSRLLDNG